MNKEQIRKNAKGKMNKQLLLIDLPLLDKAKIFADDTSIERAPFPEEKKMSVKMITAIPKMASAMTTFFKSSKLIKKTPVKDEEKSINKQDFKQLITVLKENKIDHIGYVNISESDVFKHCGVPYRHVIVFTAHQQNKPILSSPSIESQIEVGKVYGVTGSASNKASILLERLGYGAMPSHSLGGVVDYTKLGFLAGLGYPGRHGLLIEPMSGPNHRLGAIFTNINNLEEFFDQTNNHMWVKDFCAKCGKCIKKCPVNAINQAATTNEHGYTTCIDYQKCCVEFGAHYGCNICVAVCPFTTAGYDKIKQSFLKEK